MDAAVSKLVTRLEQVTARLEAVEKQLATGGGAGGSAGAAASSGPSAASIQAFDDLIAEFIPALVANTNKIGTDVLKEQVGLFQQAVKAHRDFLDMASKSKKPADLAPYLAPTSNLITQIISLRDKSRADKMFNWLSAVSEGVPAFGWVVVDKTPGPFVNEYKGNSEFYSNKILMEYKKKGADGKDNVDWVGQLNGFFKALADFIKKYHTTGLCWNASGGNAYVPAGGAAPAAAAPAPAAAKPKPKFTPAKGGGGANALFASLNKGGAVTTGLKKVTDDMKTHKNTALRAGAVVKADATKPKPVAKKFGSTPKKGTPKFALEGNKWVVEFQDDNKELIIEDAIVKQVVYVYGCTNSVLQVKGKVNAITLDNCKKTAVAFQDALASMEVVNCQSVQVQCLGKVPTFSVDKTSGCQIFLSKEGLEAEIVTSKSSEINVTIPDPDPKGDIIEIAVPEQFKTVVEGTKLKTNAVEHV